MSSRRRVLVASNYNCVKYPYSVQAFDFCNVVQQSEDGDLIAPEAMPVFQTVAGPSKEFLVKELVRRAATQVRKWADRPAVPIMQPVVLRETYDLFFYVCQFTAGLADVEQIRGWRERCRTKVAYIFETWSSLLQRERAQLKILDDFDHVFVLNGASIPNIARHTKVPCSFLPSATDALLFKPPAPPPERVIDVYSMGRRAPVTHERLLSLANRNKIFYLYDPWSSASVQDWRDSRLLTRSLIHRSKYFVAYPPNVGNPLMARQAGDENALSSRYFEGVAGGAVVIGSAGRSAEFKELFDWPDSIIEIPTAPDDMEAILADLDAQPERMARARRANLFHSLTRHDWAHRWGAILATLDLRPAPGLQERLARLDQAAAEVHREPALVA